MNTLKASVERLKARLLAYLAFVGVITPQWLRAKRLGNDGDTD